MDHTYISILTPPGVAAIAVIGVVGPKALSLVSRYFTFKTPASQPNIDNPLLSEHQPPQTQALLSRQRVFLGWFSDDQQRDQAVLLIRQLAPDCVLELHCHGGPAVVQWIVSRLEEAGATQVTNADWWNLVEPDPLVRAGYQLLSHTPTFRTAGIVLDQIEGAWRRTLTQLQQVIESAPTYAKQLIKRLCELIPVGQHLNQPFRVVLAGAPNTGKSTLLNVLVGYGRAITSPEPGTTRDAVTAEVAFDGWPILLIDTAGWRQTTDPIEREGLVRALRVYQTADLVLWLLDASTTPVLPPFRLPRCLFIINKADLPCHWSPQEIIPNANLYIAISAKTGQGLDDLVRRISHILVPRPPQIGEAVPFTPSLCEKVLALAHAIEHADWTTAKNLVTALFYP